MKSKSIHKKEWKTKSFGKCAELIKESFEPNKELPMPYIGLEHIEQQTLQLLNFGNSSNTISQKLRFKKGDILFGKLRPYFRKVISPDFDGVCSTDIFVIRCKENINQKFLYYWIASQKFVDYASKGSEGTKMPRAKWEFLEKLEKLIPDIDEQEIIGNALSTFDNQIKLLSKINKILDQIIQSVFKSWFIDFENQNNLVDSELGEIPEGWKVIPTEKAIKLLYGKSLTEKTRRVGSIPVYGSSGVVGFHNESMVKGPGIIVGRKGNVGTIFWSEVDFFPIDTVYYVESDISLHYIFQNLKRQNFINSDSSVPGLRREQAYQLPFLLPPSSLLKDFDHISESIRKKIKQNETKIEILKQIRDLLLPKLLSGEIRV